MKDIQGFQPRDALRHTYLHSAQGIRGGISLSQKALIGMGK
jgi:hypothetical protein